VPDSRRIQLPDSESSGSHRVYYRDGVREILNFQNESGWANAYQVKQLIKIIEIQPPGGLMYAIEIFYSEEDEGFMAVVPELPGCSAFGETQERALKEVKIAIQLWLETAKEIGREIPAPQKRSLMAISA
jgi:predicted RNase H-like HicB family nuclease